MKEEIDARDRADRTFLKSRSEPKSQDSKPKGSQRGSASGLVNHSSASLQQKPGPVCAFCSGNHYSDVCEKYKDYASRRTQMGDLCICCLGRNHRAKDCRHRIPCHYCKRKNHHRSLCRQQFPGTENTNFVDEDACPSEEEESGSHDTVNAVSVNAGGFRSIMQTALGKVRGMKGVASARLVFDTASSRSFVTKAKADEIGARVVGEQVVSLGRFRENRRTTVKYKIVEVDVVNRTGECKKIRLAVSDVITTPIQLFPLDTETKSKLRHVQLAEPLVAEAVSVTVDILLGLDWYFDLIDDHQIRFPSGAVFMSSFFGYVAGGRASVERALTNESNLFTFSSCSAENFELEKFWSLEDIGIKDSPANNENEVALQKFKQRVQFRGSRFYVKWPFKDSVHEIQSNFGVTFGRLKSLIRRYGNDKSVLERYDRNFRDQLELDIIEVAPKKPTGIEHYIPHQCVVKSTSSTTKFRVVFDASAKPSKDVRSLNECFYHCPLILSDLVGILLRFRLPKIALMADIEKAYLQIGLQESDRDCTRFLWLKDLAKPVSLENLVVYRFKRVPFGFGPSAFLLAAAVDLWLIWEGTPVAEDIRQNLFVDNAFGGRESLADAIDYTVSAIHIFQKASMNLREWFSNCPQAVQAIPESKRGSGACTKVLGLKWDTVSDSLSCPVGFSSSSQVVTKRQILSAAAKLFDPCGFLAPVTIQVKILMQELWTLKIGWDDWLSDDMLSRWVTCSACLVELPSIRVNRQLQASVRTANQIELRCFCDASGKAFAAAVYVRILTQKGVFVDLLLAKSRVNPVKPLAIPRLELMAVLIGCRLVQFTEKQLKLQVAEKVIWSDSKCTLHWIKGKQTYTRWVENRLAEIRSVPCLKFRYVPTKENPADLPSRGITAKELRQAQLWWHGPKFLERGEAEWPTQDIWDDGSGISTGIDSVVDPDSDLTLAVNADSASAHGLEASFEVRKYSTLRKLIGTTAYVLRFAKSNPGEKLCLTAFELDQAFWLWVKHVQDQSLPELMNSRKASFVNKRNQLNLFVDVQGIVRSRGRLENSDLAYEARNPVFLPKDSFLVSLLIRSCHDQVFHSGVQHTLAKFRDQFWIPDGRSTVQKVLGSCNFCRKIHGNPFRIPDPPPLPSFRVRQSRPFSHVGLDYLGPLFVKAGPRTSSKVWVLLLTCAAARAIHLEVVNSLSTQDFLLGFRRFMAIYGVPDIVVSDNAKQFHAGNRAVQRMWSDARKNPEVQEFVASRGIQWKFITQLAPWMGGFYERLVHPVKRALRKCLDQRCVTVFELQTVVYEIARVLNSRPLTQVDTDADSMILTPAHFLLRDSSHVPSGRASGKNETSQSETLADWKRCQRMLDQYWSMWRRQYLAELRSRLWSHHQRGTSNTQPKVGMVVQVSDKLPRGIWRLGRVANLISGADGEIRSAVIRLANGTEITRSLKFLYPLEFSCDEESAPKHPTTAKGRNTKQIPPVSGALESEVPTDSSDDE